MEYESILNGNMLVEQCENLIINLNSEVNMYQDVINIAQNFLNNDLESEAIKEIKNKLKVSVAVADLMIRANEEDINDLTKFMSVIQGVNIKGYEVLDNKKYAKYQENECLQNADYYTNLALNSFFEWEQMYFRGLAGTQYELASVWNNIHEKWQEQEELYDEIEYKTSELFIVGNDIRYRAEKLLKEDEMIDGILNIAVNKYSCQKDRTLDENKDTFQQYIDALYSNDIITKDEYQYIIYLLNTESHVPQSEKQKIIDILRNKFAEWRWKENNLIILDAYLQNEGLEWSQEIKMMVLSEYYKLYVKDDELEIGAGVSVVLEGSRIDWDKCKEIYKQLINTNSAFREYQMNDKMDEACTLLSANGFSQDEILFLKENYSLLLLQYITANNYSTADAKIILNRLKSLRHLTGMSTNDVSSKEEMFSLPTVEILARCIYQEMKDPSAQTDVLWAIVNRFFSDKNFTYGHDVNLHNILEYGQFESINVNDPNQYNAYHPDYNSDGWKNAVILAETLYALIGDCDAAEFDEEAEEAIRSSIETSCNLYGELNCNNIGNADSFWGDGINNHFYEMES